MTPYNEEVCGTCKHCKRNYNEDGAPFICFNSYSNKYAEVCNFDDECEEWEEKE